MEWLYHANMDGRVFHLFSLKKCKRQGRIMVMRWKTMVIFNEFCKVYSYGKFLHRRSAKLLLRCIFWQLDYSIHNTATLEEMYLGFNFWSLMEIHSLIWKIDADRTQIHLPWERPCQLRHLLVCGLRNSDASLVIHCCALQYRTAALEFIWSSSRDTMIQNSGSWLTCTGQSA